MDRAVLILAQAVLLAGPVAVAFSRGGYFTGTRLVALVVAYAVLAVLLARVAARGDEPPSRPAIAAIAAMALLAGWTALSIRWAPADGPAIDASERTFLYLAMLAAAALAFRRRPAAWWVEAAVAGAALVICGYGVLGQLEITGVESTLSANGRLDQPLTYWNAEGALAAIGLVLCARLAGTPERPRAVRLAGAAAAPVLGLAVYLTFSRGALMALGVGLAVLLALAPARGQLRAIAIAVAGGALAVGAFELLGEPLSAVPVVAAMALAVAAQVALAGPDDRAPLPATPRLRAAAWAVAALLAVTPFVISAFERDSATDETPAAGATAARLGSAGSNRYAYWDVALESFADHPLTGTGAGGFAAAWAQRRAIDEHVRDAHSLELETLAELGLVGLVLLLASGGAIVVAVRRVAGSDPVLVAGPAAALAVWTAHSAIDWDWEIPGLTLFAMLLVGTLLARSHRASPWAVDPTDDRSQAPERRRATRRQPSEPAM